MAFEVKFWNFPKKVNSTARPSGEGTAYGCVLLSSSGIVDPVITLERGLNSVPEFNYCYIPSFSRYYFVREWTFSNSLWTASLSVDVLATYKDQIGACNFFVTRSSEEFDGALSDTYYPVKNTYTFVNQTFQTIGTNRKIFPDAVANGRYVVGLAGLHNSAVSNIGGVAYVLMNEKVFRELLSEIWGPDLEFYGGSSGVIGGIANELAKLIIDPYQDIVSCYWVPFSPETSGGNVTQWNAGFYTFQPTEPMQVLDTTPNSLLLRSLVFEIPKHPESSERGMYLNNSPYSFYKLVLNGFGEFPVDGSKIAGNQYLNAEFYADAVSGDGWLVISTQKDADSPKVDIDRFSIPLTARVMINTANKPSLVGDSISFASTVAGDLASANVGGLISSVSSIPSIIQPTIRRTSSNGAIPTITSATALLNCIFYDVTEDDNEHHGRPLCQNKTVSALGGYMEVLDGDIALSGATEMESQTVTNYLEGGFFYE